ncbi:MAG TPA: tRNA (adenosine(37)-N6)-threonylcarbamoyltransferase complex dimerization subunit type 1 TsaB [Rhizomicrobium sp.]|nr:tRNA (adenosine(37)-N6)-threonylcarbamoyltransferase complex dimerization subunit type 1 TsaB [Rhizomicrobium sp.]
MKILAVETCLGACSVALLQGEQVLAHRWQAMERGHAEALAPMVEEILRGADIHSLDRLAVTVGPGTFTGQRVGLSFMRGLRLALDKPLTGITSLEAMAAAACAETGALPIKKPGRAAAIHDARRDEAYLALVEKGVMTMPPRVLPFAAALEAIRNFGPCVLAGTGAPAARDALGEDFLLSSIRQPDALFVARLALLQPVPAAGAPPPAPLYLRAPDAKLPGGRELVALFEGDPSVLAGLHAQAFPSPLDGAALQSLLAGPGVFAFAAASGFVLARAAAGEAEILTLAVLPAARGRGLGRDLMQAAATHAARLGAETLFLEVGTDNPAALALYNSLGFTRAGTRKGYYPDSQSQVRGDALVLKAALPLAGKLA